MTASRQSCQCCMLRCSRHHDDWHTHCTWMGSTSLDCGQVALKGGCCSLSRRSSCMQGSRHGHYKMLCGLAHSMRSRVNFYGCMPVSCAAWLNRYCYTPHAHITNQACLVVGDCWAIPSVLCSAPRRCQGEDRVQVSGHKVRKENACSI